MAMIAEVDRIDTLTFSEALEQAEVLARQALPAVMYERISCGVALARAGKVLEVDPHHWTVESATTPGKRYQINGICSCDDRFYHAHEGPVQASPGDLPRPQES